MKKRVFRYREVSLIKFLIIFIISFIIFSILFVSIFSLFPGKDRIRNLFSRIGVMDMPEAKLIVTSNQISIEDVGTEDMGDFADISVNISIAPISLGMHTVPEGSGIVASRRYAGIYWMMGDSGQAAAVYAVNSSGATKSVYVVNGAANRDWEDITLDESDNIWVAETGDNSQVWNDYSYYVFPEPDPYAGGGMSAPSTKYTFIYPDGKKDSEASFVWQGHPYMVQKRPTNARVYWLRELNSSKTVTAEFVGEFNNNNNWITGADISRDGRRLALIHDGNDYHWIIERNVSSTNISDFFTSSMVEWRVQFANGQGEAISFVNGSYDFVVANEEGNLWRINQGMYDNVTNCSNGAISSLCKCGTADYNYGYCCAGVWGESICTAGLKQVIFIGVDGMQYNHYKEMLAAGKLGNFTRLMASNGWNGSANITGHVNTETAPGNAELHTGLNQTLNTIIDNTCGRSVPAGKTEYERIHTYNSSVILGLVYGKGTCYIPDAVLSNAKPVVPFWYNRTNYLQTTYLHGSSSAYCENVSNKAREFIANYSNKSFFLTVYFGVLDATGHEHGENSVEYDNAFINVDKGVGILLDALTQYGIENRTQIILSADHGFIENGGGHSPPTADTIIIPIVTNNASMTAVSHAWGLRKQCDIAPTILNYFGMNSSDYADIDGNGCGSMIGASSGSSCVDADNDGYNTTSGSNCGSVADCNDSNFLINPGATELCNGVDDNCANGIDEGCSTIFPQIKFIPPTPNNGDTRQKEAEINVSIIDDNLRDIKFVWDGNNYAILNGSLILMANFDKRSSLGENETYIVDMAGGENNGSVVGATWTSNGRYGGAYNFDGNDYISFGALGALTDRSVSVWVRGTSWAHTDTNDNAIYAFNTAAGGNTDMARINTSGSVGIYNGGTRQCTGSNVSINTGEWHNLFFVTRGTTSYIYLDGFLTGSCGTWAPAVGATDILYAAQEIDTATPSDFFNGLEDEFRVWNRALSADEIKEAYYSNLQKYNQTQWYFYVNQSSLIPGIYNYQASASDTSGNNNATELRSVIISSSVVCGDGFCSAGENCSSDAVNCSDNNCYEPSCINGCGEVPVSNGGNDEACLAPNYCDGAGSCVAPGTLSVDMGKIVGASGNGDGKIALLAGTVKNVVFNFSANGSVGNLNDSSAKAVFYKNRVNRMNSSCRLIYSAANKKTYGCTIGMWFYDEVGDWAINVNVSDNSGNVYGNNSEIVSVETLREVILSTASINFPGINPGNINVLALNMPLNITNWGNYESNVSVLGHNLHGITNRSEYINVNNFRAGIDSNVCNSGSSLVNGTAVSVSGSWLPRGATAKEELYYCLTNVPAVSTQVYSTLQGYGWRIGFF